MKWERVKNGDIVFSSAHIAAGSRETRNDSARGTESPDGSPGV